LRARSHAPARNHYGAGNDGQQRSVRGRRHNDPGTTGQRVMAAHNQCRVCGERCAPPRARHVRVTSAG
jgi:hypothetical protein